MGETTKRGTLLAIDSSTAQAGIALYDGDRVAELSWVAGRSHTTSLLGQIHHLLSLSEVTANELAAIAVATGPGTFSGLRVGISVAKGLVLGLGVPLIGVPTLTAAALPFAGAAGAVVAVVAAGRDRLVWAEYRDGATGWTETAPARNGTIVELAADLSARAPVVVTGEIALAHQEPIARLARVTLIPAPLRSRRPVAVAAIGWARLLSHDVDDPATLEPVYLGREPIAQPASRSFPGEPNG